MYTVVTFQLCIYNNFLLKYDHDTSFVVVPMQQFRTCNYICCRYVIKSHIAQVVNVWEYINITFINKFLALWYNMEVYMIFLQHYVTLESHISVPFQDTYTMCLPQINKIKLASIDVGVLLAQQSTDKFYLILPKTETSTGFNEIRCILSSKSSLSPVIARWNLKKFFWL